MDESFEKVELKRALQLARAEGKRGALVMRSAILDAEGHLSFEHIESELESVGPTAFLERQWWDSPRGGGYIHRRVFGGRICSFDSDSRRA